MAVPRPIRCGFGLKEFTARRQAPANWPAALFHEGQPEEMDQTAGGRRGRSFSGIQGLPGENNPFFGSHARRRVGGGLFTRVCMPGHHGRAVDQRAIFRIRTVYIRAGMSEGRELNFSYRNKKSFAFPYQSQGQSGIEKSPESGGHADEMLPRGQGAFFAPFRRSCGGVGEDYQAISSQARVAPRNGKRAEAFQC